MVKVNITYDNKVVNKVTLKGHSGYDMVGKDIVCSSISSIVITTVNGIISLYDESAISSNYLNDCLTIEILKNNEIIDKLIINMINLLKELEKQYKKNIEIKEVY